MLLTFLFALVTYDPTDILARIKRYGYGVAGIHSATDASAHLNRILVCASLQSIMLLWGLAMLPSVMLLAFGISESRLFSVEVLVVGAICVSITQYVRANLITNVQARANKDENASGWVSLFSADTIIEGELVKEILADIGIDSRVISNRVISATGTLGAWEVCRPRFPSIMIHPRLGKGSVNVIVCANVAAEAQEVLQDRELIPRTFMKEVTHERSS